MNKRNTECASTLAKSFDLLHVGHREQEISVHLFLCNAFYAALLYLSWQSQERIRHIQDKDHIKPAEFVTEVADVQTYLK